MFLTLFFLAQSAHASTIIIDFEAVEITAERVVPSIRLVQESSHEPLQTTFDYQQLVGILRERLVNNLFEESREREAINEILGLDFDIDIPDPDSFSSIDMQIALYGSRTVESLPVGIYEFNIYSNYSRELETGHILVSRDGDRTQIQDLPSNKWCSARTYQNDNNPFTGEPVSKLGCTDEHYQPGPFASRYIWNSADAEGIFEPAANEMLVQAQMLLKSSHFTGWCPEGMENESGWNDIESLCMFKLPSVQIYELDQRSISDKSSRIFVLGPPQSHVMIQTGFLGFLRYISDPEQEAQAAIDEFINKNSGPRASVNPEDGQVYTCDDVSVVRLKNHLRFSYKDCRRPLSGWADGMATDGLPDDAKMTGQIGWTKSFPLDIIDLDRHTLGLAPVIEILR